MIEIRDLDNELKAAVNDSLKYNLDRSIESADSKETRSHIDAMVDLCCPAGAR